MRVPAVAAALGLLLGVSGPATAARPRPAGPWLVVSGQGNRYADVTLTRPLTFDSEQSLFLTSSGCGRYHGFYFRPLSPSLRPFTRTGTAGVGMFAAASFDYPEESRWPVPLGTGVGGGTRPTLQPGRYRLLLLGEGRCEVRMPVAGGLKRDWRVHARSEWRGVRFAEQSLVPTGQRTVGPFAGAASVPIDVREGDFVLAVMHTWSRRPARGIDREASGETVCIDDFPEGRCAPSALGDGRKRYYAWHVYGYYSNTSSQTASDNIVFLLPNNLPTGRLYAKGTAAIATVGGDVSAVLAVIAFPT